MFLINQLDFDKKTLQNCISYELFFIFIYFQTQCQKIKMKIYKFEFPPKQLYIGYHKVTTSIIIVFFFYIFWVSIYLYIY